MTLVDANEELHEAFNQRTGSPGGYLWECLCDIVLNLKREPWWTESLTVRSAGFVERIKPLILSRRDTENTERGKERWVLEEAARAYGQTGGSKSAAKRVPGTTLLRKLLKCGNRLRRQLTNEGRD